MLESVLECVLVMLSCSRVCESERLFELSDIEVAWRDGVPVQHMRISREEVLHIWKCLAQLVEQLAQVIASLGLGASGQKRKARCWRCWGTSRCKTR